MEIPHYWIDCPNISTDLIADTFIVFKIPLNSNYDKKLNSQNKFYPKTVFEICDKYNINLGLWIDLTNSSTFYTNNEITEHGCIYHKLKCSYYRKTPRSQHVLEFNKIVGDFIRNNPSKRVAVHCSLGFNITGYMIVSYLIEEKSYSLDDALDLFTKVRYPGIFQQSLINDLYQTYDHVSNTRTAIFNDWIINNQQATKTSVDNVPADDFKKIKYMEGVMECTNQNDAQQMRIKFQQTSGWLLASFPGTFPVSLTKSNINMLSKEPYNVTYNCVGYRYMMLINGKNGSYFYDRNNSIFFVNGMQFVDKRSVNNYIENTIVDGTMVLSQTNGNYKQTYIINDIICLHGNDVHKKPFGDRLQLIQEEIIAPREKLINSLRLNINDEPFVVTCKEFYNIKETKYLFSDEFKASISFKTDGVSFISNRPYAFATSYIYLKWNENNQLKFKLKLVNINRNGKSIMAGEIYLHKSNKHFAMIEYTDDLKNLDGKVIACNFVDNQWRFLEARSDKAFPNGIKTAEGVCESIRDNITKEYLLEYIEKEAYDEF